MTPSSISSPIDALEEQYRQHRTLSTADVTAASTADSVVVIPGEIIRNQVVTVVADDHDDDDDDCDKSTENLSNRNNLSGSYSNLYRGEKLDCGDAQNDDHQLFGLGARPNHSGDIDLIASAVGPEGTRENVYSNVPFTATDSNHIISPGTVVSQDDPSSHVYSNIASPTLTASSAVTASGGVEPSSANRQQLRLSQSPDFNFGDISAILHSPANNSSATERSENDHRGHAVSVVVTSPSAAAKSTAGGGRPVAADSVAHHISSTMMADDLDLDDPVTAASAFAMSPTKCKTTGSGAAASLVGENAAGHSIEMKNVIAQVSFTFIILGLEEKKCFICIYMFVALFYMVTIL